MKKKTQHKKEFLTLHGLLGALSFWGTAARGLLFAILAAAVFVVALTEVSSNAGFDNEIMLFIYVLGSFFVLDAGYVLISRTYRLLKPLDLLALAGAEVILAMLYIVPKVVVSQDIVLRVEPLTFAIFIPIIALSIRMLMGLLFGITKR